MRLGILWFFVALAAVTAGRWTTALLWGVTAAVAAREVVFAWWTVQGLRAGELRRPPRSAIAVVVLLAALPPVAAALGTGFAGGILLLVALALVVIVVAARTRLVGLSSSEAAAVAVAVLLPALPATAVVLVTATDVWAAIFLVVAVSMYDAGYYIGAAESSSLLEGPVTGLVGVVAVTFTMAIFQASPFSTTSAVIAGCLCAAACPVGQWATSSLLPDGSSCRVVRRLDAYLFAAPVLLAVTWAIL